MTNVCLSLVNHLDLVFFYVENLLNKNKNNYNISLL